MNTGIIILSATYLIIGITLAGKICAGMEDEDRKSGNISGDTVNIFVALMAGLIWPIMIILWVLKKIFMVGYNLHKSNK